MTDGVRRGVFSVGDLEAQMVSAALSQSSATGAANYHPSMDGYHGGPRSHPGMPQSQPQPLYDRSGTADAHNRPLLSSPSVAGPGYPNSFQQHGISSLNNNNNQRYPPDYGCQNSMWNHQPRPLMPTSAPSYALGGLIPPPAITPSLHDLAIVARNMQADLNNAVYQHNELLSIAAEFEHARAAGDASFYNPARAELLQQKIMESSRRIESIHSALDHVRLRMSSVIPSQPQAPNSFSMGNPSSEIPKSVVEKDCVKNESEENGASDAPTSEPLPPPPAEQPLGAADNMEIEGNPTVEKEEVEEGDSSDTGKNKRSRPKFVLNLDHPSTCPFCEEDHECPNMAEMEQHIEEVHMAPPNPRPPRTEDSNNSVWSNRRVSRPVSAQDAAKGGRMWPRGDSLRRMSNVLEPLLNDMAPTAEFEQSKIDLLNLLKKEVAALWEGAELFVFGSSGNGFGMKASDVDLCLIVDDIGRVFTGPKVAATTRSDEADNKASLNDDDDGSSHVDTMSVDCSSAVKKESHAPRVKMISELAKSLRDNYRWNIPRLATRKILSEFYTLVGNLGMENRLFINATRVPIVKFTYTKTALPIHGDVCLNNALAVRNTRLLYDYSRLDRRVPMLGRAVKHWAKCRGINNASNRTLTSYGFIIMMLHYLQHTSPPILPCLQDVDPDDPQIEKCEISGRNCTYQTDLTLYSNFSNNNKQDIGELLFGFFLYFSRVFDFRNEVVTIRRQRRLTKMEKMWGKKQRHMCIEDPFELNHDLGGVVDPPGLDHIRYELDRAVDVLYKTASFERLCNGY